jgi:hypothetical protein
MKSTIIRYGLYAAAILIVLFCLSWLLMTAQGSLSYNASEVVGWVSILVSLAMIPLGMRHYRDKVNEGRLSLGKGLQLGVLIGLLPAVAMGIITYFIFPMFIEVFQTHFEQELANAESSMTAEQIEAYRVQMGPGSLYWNPFFQAGVMFFSVLVAGFFVALLSAFFLKKGSE